MAKINSTDGHRLPEPTKGCLCNRIGICLLTLAIAFLSSISINAQPAVPHFFTGYEKKDDVNSLFADLFVKSTILYTDVNILEKYNATTINSNNLSKKTENSFSLGLLYQNLGKFKPGIESEFVLSHDSKSIGNHTLYDVSIVPTLAYFFSENNYLKVGAGKKITDKFGIFSDGPAVLADLNFSDFDYENFSGEASVRSRYFFFDDDRTNRDILAKLKVSANSSEVDKIELNTSYGDKLVDFITFVRNNPEDYLYEMNTDKLFNSQILIDYYLIKDLQFKSSIEYFSQSKRRVYDKSSEFVNASLYGRKSESVKFSTSNVLLLLLDKLKSSFSLDYESTEEHFDAFKNSENFDNSQLASVKNTQKMNDYSASKLQISTANTLLLGRRDSLSVNLLASIYRYDTPHKDNKDEHDESFSSLYVQYAHRFTRRFNYRVLLDVKHQHYVYLNAEKSAGSNAVKTIRLRFGPEYKNDVIFLNPTLEVLANYHIYDFAKTSGSVSTYSFRQISYQDSIVAKLNEKFLISLNSSIRYSERGILYWDSFSELPISGNFEIMFKCMIYRHFRRIYFGLGSNYYKLKQDNLQMHRNTHLSKIISPEAVIGIKFSNENVVRLVGKYDFQDIGGATREVANLNLQANVYF